MSRKELNLGILAHVDAGKTTLTERLLYEAGVIDAVGSVDHGTTQTDFLALERQRGITIRSAVASFDVGDDLHVNLIDTPGHPDFIAEVERVLGVLDAAVLVVSGVEGVQPQTRILMRALQRLRVPTLFFVNKLDRVGADEARVRREIEERLAPEPGTEVLAGSAVTGAGVRQLVRRLERLRSAADDRDVPLTAKVFKIERGPKGEKVAYVRVFSGTLRTRDRVGEAKVTALAVFERGGTPARRQSVAAGGVAKVWGLADARIGDRLGDAPRDAAGAQQFPPPTLESVVDCAKADRHRLRLALARLAEQDPLIAVRQDDSRHELSVSLYGEVQKEVLQATLASEYGVEATFRDATVIYLERPAAAGEALEVLHAETNPFNATIGLRVEPAAPGDGVSFTVAVDHTGVPLYVYKRLELFTAAMDDYVRGALAEGLHGWEVSDCVVTLIESGYSVPDGPPSRRGPLSTAADFRKLTPIVLMKALAASGTVVCEPMLTVRVEAPPGAVGALLAAVARLEGRVEAPSFTTGLATVEAVLPAARVLDLQRLLPGLTSGEGTLETSFAGYEPLLGDAPRRPRTTPSPLDLEAYLAHLAGRR